MGNRYNQYFTDLLEYSVGEIRSNGYHWYKNEFEKKLIEAEKTGADPKILSQVWMISGDIWDVNGVPVQAITSYKKALKWNASNKEALFELAKVHMEIGAYPSALQYIKSALELDNDNEEYEALFYDINYCINHKEPAAFSPNDRLWWCAEKIAEGRFTEVLETLDEVSTVEELRLKAQCYGALDYKEKYIETWYRIYRMQEMFSLHWVDWFYMPESIHDGEEIWNIFIKLNGRMRSNSVFEFFDMGPERVQTDLLQTRELTCFFYIYSARKDAEGLQKLLQCYPEWEEVKNELTLLNMISDQLSNGDT